MQFFRDKLDPTFSKDNTPIPAFKSYYEVSPEDFEAMKKASMARSNAFYYVRSMDYYSIKPKAVAKDANRNDDELPITIRRNAGFAISTHGAIVADHTRLYKEKYDALFKLDMKIIACFVLAVTAMSIPLIPYVGLLSFGFWMATCYFLSQRTNMYNDYHDSLILLATTCNWALGSNSHTDDPKNLAKAPEIRDMLDCLFAVLTKTQVKHLIDDPIEKHFTEALDNYDSRFKFPLVSGLFSQPNRAAQVIDKELENTALKQRGADLIRCAYGLNRGHIGDFLRILVLAIPEFLRAGYNAGKAYFTPAETTTRMTNA